MWPGRQSGAADKTDNFSLRDAPPRSHPLAKRRKVGIQGFVSIRMAHHCYISITALSTDKSDVAISCRSNPRTGRGAVVNALMGSPCLKHRVKTRVRKSGCHAREFNRRAQES